MARVVQEVGAGTVVVLHVGPDGGFAVSDALHPDVLPAALAHGLTTIVVSQRALGEADTETLLVSGGVADLASADFVPPSLLRRRLEAHMTHSRARALSSSLSPGSSLSPSWQSLSGHALLSPTRVTHLSAEQAAGANGDNGQHLHAGQVDPDGLSDGEEGGHVVQPKEKQSKGDLVNPSLVGYGAAPPTPRSVAAQHLSVVEGLLLQLDRQGYSFAADYPELSRLVVRLLRDLHSTESSVFQPAEDLFREKCTDNTTREWIVETYTRRPSISDLGLHSSSLSLKRTLSLSQAGRAVKTWHFNAFECSEDMLESLVPQIFDSELQLLKIFNVPLTVFSNFVRQVRRHYQANPYHNFIHAFDVLQTVYSLLFITDAINFLTELDIFALLVSALCHDLSHPGTNNAFQVNNLTPLALVYNDVSVLENHHVSTLFRILQAGGGPESPATHANIFVGLTKEQFKEVRTIIIKNVLGTDMSYHFESTNLFKARTCAHTGAGDKSAVSLRPDVKDDRQLMMKILLHTADISNQAKPWEIASRWAAKVTEEFLAQGELERQAGGPVSPGMDKTKVKMEQMTANFIEVVLEPLFSALAAYFPSLSPQHSQLLDNKRKWRSLESA